MAGRERLDTRVEQGPGARRLWAAVLFCVLLSGCSALRQDPQITWPEGIPPASYFVEFYENDPENQPLQLLKDYLYWIESFYEGTPIFPRGWSDLVEDQLAGTNSSDEAADRANQLYLLGRDIAADWARDNSVRRIDNRHLAVWGQAAGRALDEGNVDETLARIAADVEMLLSGDLLPKAVQADRYHAQDPDDFFAF